MSAAVPPPSRQKALAARLYVDVFGRGDLATADALLAPDAISHGPGTPPTVGAAGIKAQAMILRTAIPDLTVELEDQVEEGDRVTSRWRATGHQTGPLRLPGATVEPAGTAIEFSEIRIDRFEGERIVESWFLPDRFSLWRQLGLIPG
jgi:predicted ester cyclase